MLPGSGLTFNLPSCTCELAPFRTSTSVPYLHLRQSSSSNFDRQRHHDQHIFVRVTVAGNRDRDLKLPRHWIVSSSWLPAWRRPVSLLVLQVTVATGSELLVPYQSAGTPGRTPSPPDSGHSELHGLRDIGRCDILRTFANCRVAQPEHPVGPLGLDSMMLAGAFRA